MSDKTDPKESSLVPTTVKPLTTRSSALVRRGLNDLEAIDNSEPGHDGGQNSDKMGPSKGKTHSVREALAELLEEKGSVAEVGPDYYGDFLNLNDDQMGGLIGLVILASEKELNRMLLDEEGSYTHSALLKNIENKLWLISRGWLRFGEDEKLYMFKPDGPEPTPEMEQLLDARLNRAVPQIGLTLIDLVRRSAKNSI
jgi:hypothetical protein